MKYYSITAPSGRFVGFRRLGMSQLRRLVAGGWFCYPLV
jgi:hypothetical protein